MKKIISFLKDKNIDAKERLNLNGSGWIEESAVVDGYFLGIFFIGAYSLIEANAHCRNTFIGRFCIVERNVTIGYQELKENSFSIHHFANGNYFGSADKYYSELNSRYFYEKHKQTIIGSDVLIGRDSFIQEGCHIGNGVIIKPNSFVDSDIPDYAIVAGSPAKIIGYRFSEPIIEKLLSSKWWMKDLTPLVKNKRRDFDYVNNIDFINTVSNAKLNSLNKKRYYINRELDIMEINKTNNFIFGASTAYFWNLKCNKKELERVKDFHIIGLSSTSIFSYQANNIIKWILEWFEKVIYLVTDFRVGNIAIDAEKPDGKFVKRSEMNTQNSQECYRLAINQLDQLAKEKNILFLFWQLYGRESFNKLANKYINNGVYCHPIWNYKEIVNRYEHNIIDISKYFSYKDIPDMVVDSALHPSNSCYQDLESILSKYI